MKKILSVLLALSIVLACVLGMSACGKEDTEGTQGGENQTQKTYAIEEVAEAAKKMSFTKSGMETAYCPKCNEEVTWWELTSETGLDSETGAVKEVYGHFYLGGDVKKDHALSLRGGDSCIHLNGYTLSFDGRNSGADLSVIIGGGPDVAVTVMGDGYVVSANRACAVTNGGILNICGGTYETLTNTDPCIRTNNLKSDIRIYAGRIKGAVRLTEGNTDAKLSISGDVSMEKLIVQTNVANIGTLPEGSQIEVEATGVFTADFETTEAAEAAAKCFVAADDTMKVVVEGKALSCVAK